MTNESQKALGRAVTRAESHVVQTRAELMKALEWLGRGVSQAVCSLDDTKLPSSLDQAMANVSELRAHLKAHTEEAERLSNLQADIEGYET